MQLNITNVLLMMLGITLVLCFILMIMNSNSNGANIENFDPVVDAIQLQLQNETPDQLKGTIKTLQQRLIDYGYAPDLNSYIKKTELMPNSGRCLVTNAEDRDKYISKSDSPIPGPRIDLSQYIKKSSIPPNPVCPPVPEIDYSAYVKKSTLPPDVKCPPCIAPKVKVSAGLCRECPPAPSCPAPERCPELKCPEPAPCSPAQVCPPPAACPTQAACTKCDEVRYIKIPTVITKTVFVDSSGNVISQNINSGSKNSNPTQYLSQPAITKANTTQPNTTQPNTTQPLVSLGYPMSTTTFPTMSNIPNITLAQTLDSLSGSKSAFCPNSELNSDFKQYGIYGI